MDHKYKITSFCFVFVFVFVCFFSLTVEFFKMLIDLAFPIPTLSLFHSFVKYGKDVLLKDFVLAGIDLIIDTDDDDLSK